MYRATLLAVMTLALVPPRCLAQLQSPPSPDIDSVSVAPGARYAAGSLHQFFFGNSYRDLWKTPLKVPVLNLHTFAGGLRPTRLSGGLQTVSLRFVGKNGNEYVFRSVDKDNVVMPPRFKGSVVEDIVRDQVSSSHPAAALVAAPLQDAAGVLHPHPILVVMPDDPALGEFRKQFAGRLGMIEEYPSVPAGRKGFGEAVEIIDSDDLLERINTDPMTRVDAVALLNARLTDMFFNDWDRHAGQWKWARILADSSGPWIPIARDRDKAFISYDGLIPSMARMAAANLVSFEGSYPSIRGLTWNSIEFDRRLLSGLEKPVWDSVAQALVRRLDERTIDRAVQSLPAEHCSSAPALARTLKERRDHLPEVASRFYQTIANIVDIHGTDAPDKATIALRDDTVEVRLRGGPGEGHEYFRRRFVAGETREIRVYLHDGDDLAVITDQASRSIPVRIIGGNGNNLLIDSAVVGGRRGTAHLYQAGRVQGVEMGPDTLFDRRPWVHDNGKLVPPGRDRGGRMSPILGLTYHGDYGFIPRFGISQYRYGFGKRPYARRIALGAEYATLLDGWRVELLVDKRLEFSPIHFMTVAGMSQLEVVRYHGLGNNTVESGGSDFFDIDQRQWLAHVAVAYALGPRSDLILGPIVKYVITDSTSGRFISNDRPYGFAEFGQAGLRLTLHHDVRDQPRQPRKGMVIDLNASYYPAVWDAVSAFGSTSATVATYTTLPIPLRPILALRGGATKVFGAFPWYEAAFLGGGANVRNLDAQRFAGDAALAGSAELRLPVASFSFILPLDVGLFGLADAGRVYLDGESTGGWHTALGGGFWVGILDPASALSFAFTNGQERTGVFIKAGLTF
jgi:hypothetical protein